MDDQSRDFWILALSGGGYRGLFTSTVLAEMERLAGCPIAKKFDLIAGTSVGSILAAALAKEVPAERLPALFLAHGREIFNGTWKHLPLLRRLNLGFFGARYGSSGLEQLLLRDDLLGDSCFNDVQHRLMIPSINLSKGAAQFFKTQHISEYKFDGGIRLVDAVMASAAAPTFFPVHRFNNSRYADGGLVANSPSFIALHEACHKLNWPIDRIHVVSIGTMNKTVTADPRSSLDMGLVTSGGWSFWNQGWRQRLFEVTVAAQEALSEAMLGHVLTKDRVLRIDAELSDDQSKCVGLDWVTAQANEVLRGQGREAAKRFLTGPIFDRWMKHTAAPATFFNQA